MLTITQNESKKSCIYLNILQLTTAAESAEQPPRSCPGFPELQKHLSTHHRTAETCALQVFEAC